tara:strand:+ start:470 stop:1147 length:678 start_codon:yes stop_codon:yes gene_type:complete
MRVFLIILLFFVFLINFSVHAFPIPKNNKVTYDIWRKNRIIGEHEILFSENDGILNIETNIDIEVKIFFVSAYTFFHTSKEVWKNGKFIKIDGYSDFEDEREYFIKGEVKDDFLFASGMDGELKLDKNLIPSNFWNIDVMYQDEIFDTQKGIVRKLDVKEVGKELITINNEEINCTKFILNATRHPKDKDLFPEYTLWYSEDKELMRFNFVGTIKGKMVELIRKQ